MNLVGPWFGALPCCHGAGGLAAQVGLGLMLCVSGAWSCPVRLADADVSACMHALLQSAHPGITSTLGAWRRPCGGGAACLPKRRAQSAGGVPGAHTHAQRLALCQLTGQPRPGQVLTGTAAQVRFGARSGAAPILLGLGKLLAGLLFGSSLLALLQAFPKGLLGALLIFSGALAGAGNDVQSLLSCCCLHAPHASTVHLSSVGRLAGRRPAACVSRVTISPLVGPGTRTQAACLRERAHSAQASPA